MKTVMAILAFLLPLSALAAPDGATRIVARIGERTITQAQLERILDLYTTETKRQMARNPQFKTEILRKYIEAQLLSQKAREKDIDRLPDVKERLEIFSNEILAQAYLEKEVAAKIQPSDPELRLYYDQHQAEFTRPEAVRLRQILVRAGATAPPEERQRAREKAEIARKRLEDGADFGQVAAELIDDQAMKRRGGALGVVPRGKLAPEIEKTVFALEPGQASPVLETNYGYTILKVDEKLAGGTLPFEEVKDRVRQLVLVNLKQRRVSEFKADLLRQAGVELFPERPDEEASEPPHTHPSRGAKQGGMP